MSEFAPPSYTGDPTLARCPEEYFKLGFWGLQIGLAFTAADIIWFKFVDNGPGASERWLWGISPEGIGSIGMLLNFAVALVLQRFGPPPTTETQQMIEDIRVPRAS